MLGLDLSLDSLPTSMAHTLLLQKRESSKVLLIGVFTWRFPDWTMGSPCRVYWVVDRTCGDVSLWRLFNNFPRALDAHLYVRLDGVSHSSTCVFVGWIRQLLLKSLRVVATDVVAILCCLDIKQGGKAVSQINSVAEVQKCTSVKG